MQVTALVLVIVIDGPLAENSANMQKTVPNMPKASPTRAGDGARARHRH